MWKHTLDTSTWMPYKHFKANIPKCTYYIFLCTCFSRFVSCISKWHLLALGFSFVVALQFKALQSSINSFFKLCFKFISFSPIPLPQMLDKALFISYAIDYSRISASEQFSLPSILSPAQFSLTKKLGWLPKCVYLIMCTN